MQGEMEREEFIIMSIHDYSLGLPALQNGYSNSFYDSLVPSMQQSRSQSCLGCPTCYYVPVKFRTPIYFVGVYSAERKIRVKNKANISIKELLQHTFIVEQGYDYFHTRLHFHGIK